LASAKKNTTSQQCIEAITDTDGGVGIRRPFVSANSQFPAGPDIDSANSFFSFDLGFFAGLSSKRPVIRSAFSRLRPLNELLKGFNCFRNGAVELIETYIDKRCARL
jgi:hypothetical protein